MRLVVVSDTHGSHDRVDVPEGDVLVHAGDLTGPDTLRGVREFDDWLAELPHPEKIVIAGNCDGVFEDRRTDAAAALEHATYLQDDGMTVEGLSIWGSPWQPEFLNLAFNLERGEPLAEKWAQIPETTDVLVTHGPPRGILDETSRGEVVGCRALRERVDELSLRAHIFGHVHESSGRLQRDGTTYVNAACDAAGKSPFVLEL